MKAIGLFSGGLDSCLAIKIIKDQGIEVIAFSVISPFFGNSAVLEKSAGELGVELEILNVDREYFRIVKNPRHGHGKNLNPCIDCKIFILRKAKKLADKVGADFIFTGEVIGQRPMSQQMHQMELIEKEAGLKGKLLRPLSAKLLNETEAEKEHWVNRTNLLAIHGRGREEQMRLAKQYGIVNYTSPAGGCLLTCEDYCAKLKDLIENKSLTPGNVGLLRAGRHFRIGAAKIIVGRNKEDNDKIVNMKIPADFLFESADISGPISLLRGKKSKENILAAARLTAGYSDAKDETVKVKYGRNLEKLITCSRMPREESENMRITTKFKKGLK